MGGVSSQDPGAGRSAILVAIAIVALLAAACRSTAPAGRTAAGSETPPAEDAAGEADAHDAPVYQNTIKWSTASELDNFGFDVYRGESPEGPFERLTPEAIEGGGTIDTPRRYEFVDDTIDPCRTYYYYVESISMSGDRERFTPIGRAPPKAQAPCRGDG